MKPPPDERTRLRLDLPARLAADDEVMDGLEAVHASGHVGRGAPPCGSLWGVISVVIRRTSVTMMSCAGNGTTDRWAR